MTSPGPALRWGIMCSGDELPATFAASVRELLHVEGLELSLLIIDDDPPVRSGPAQKLRKLLLFRGALWPLYQRLFPWKKLDGYRPVNMSAEFEGVPRLRCRTLKKGKFSRYFQEQDLAEIRRYRLDFVLRFAFGIIRGEILQVPTYGVWSFHHGDEMQFRGAPPAFWEIYRGSPISAAVLQRLTDRLDGGVILQKVWIRTRPTSHGANLNAILAAAAHLPARVVRDLLNGCADYLQASPSRTNARIYYDPNDFQMLRFLFKCGIAWLGQQMELFFPESWNVGVVRAPIQYFLKPEFRPSVEWFPRRAPDRFIADPFVFENGGTTRILMEEFDYFQNRGRIVQVTVADGGLNAPVEPVIDEPTHSAYPYVFRDADQIYCVPETYQQKRIWLYGWDAESRRWEKHMPLIEGIAAVDATVFQHDGRWWLWCTNRESDPDAALHLWYAPALDGPWEPHAANPVKVDVRSSRPAGTPFLLGGQLYRPAQDCSRGYGSAVSINRVERLTPTEFREETIMQIKPQPDWPYREGVHTLAGFGSITVLDGKRYVFAPNLIGRRLRHKLWRLTQLVKRR